MILTLLILPVVYIVLGIIFWKYPPQKINSFAGWRTKQAMKNQATWNFANINAGKAMFVLGVILAAVFIVLDYALNPSKDWITASAIIQVALFGIVIYRVENAIKINFDENGQRK